MVDILLADDHAILRSGLKLLLESQPDFKVVGEAGDGDEALKLARALQPELILLDINMPGKDGLSILPTLKKDIPNVHILILTMHDDVSYLQEALRAGAAGYVLKRAVDSELLLAIRIVLRGEPYVHSSMTQKLLQKMDAPEPAPKTEQEDGWSTLSERELDVLKLVALGYTNAEIAAELFLSVKTVETYRARGMEKLNLQTRAQLVKAALQKGLLD